MTRAVLAAACLALGLMAGAAHAGGYRTIDFATDLKPEIWGEREILPGKGVVALDGPVRAADDRRVPIGIHARLLDGGLVRSVTLVIDENPMPVSAILTLSEPKPSVRFGIDMRLNGPSPVRAVVETTDGRLYMTERLVKTSGLGACAAPPVGDPEAAIAAIGQMQARETAAAEGISTPERMVRLEMRHPQHTGLQRDQITLLPILARYVETVEVGAGGKPLFTLEGSISISEDPAVEFDVAGTGADAVEVRMTDTSGTVVERRLPLAPES